jgi:acetyl esterase/lipase
LEHVWREERRDRIVLVLVLVLVLVVVLGLGRSERMFEDEFEDEDDWLRSSRPRNEGDAPMPICVPRSRKAVNLWPDAAPTPDGVNSGVEPFLVPCPVRGKPRGAVVVCPGGGYQGLAQHESFPIADWLNEAGIGAFVLRYRHSPHRHPVPLMDAQRAIRLVRARAEEWNVKPDRVAILGFSAGGHLTSSAATHFDAGRRSAKDPVERQSCRPDAAILCYPVITFMRGWNKGTRTNLLGRKPPTCPPGVWREALGSLSNERQVTPRTPPTFLWHTSDDPIVRVEDSLIFAEALRRNKVPFELHVFPHGQHGLGLARDNVIVGRHRENPVVGQWTALCVKWLVGLGF